MKIKFHNTLYFLLSDVNVTSTHFQATIEKGDNTFDEIIADTVNAEEITVYNDEDEVIGVYTGYTKRIAICIIEYISVELANADVEAQIDALTSSINAVEEVQDAQADNIAELNTRVDDITPYTETKVGYYGETEKTFYNVPNGNVSVFFNNYNGSYNVNRIEDRLIVSFDALEKETNITISIQ